MSARGKIPLNHDGRSAQAPGMMRHGPFPGLDGPGGRHPREPLSRPESLEKQMAAQEEDLKQLASDNRRFAGAHVALREELAAAQQEIQSIKAHIRSIQTESDIQIRVLLDKRAKMGADVGASEGVKKELEQSHIEAQSLTASRQKLSSQIQKNKEELQRVRADIRRLPEMHAELDSLTQEHQRLRTTFEYEKGLNIEQREKMEAMEKKMLAMAREVERLRAEVLNAENRARGPNYGGAYMSTDLSYPPAQGNGTYVDGYGRPYLPQMGIGYPGENASPYNTISGPLSSGSVPAAPVPVSGAGAVWAGTFDPSCAGR